MDDVKLLIASNLGGNLRIAVHLFHQILAVTATEDVFALGTVAAGNQTAVNLVHHVVIVVQPNVGHQLGVDLYEGGLCLSGVELGMARVNLHVARVDNLGVGLVFVARCLGHDEGNLHAVERQSFGKTVAGCAQTS